MRRINDGFEYVDKNEFYDGPACYSFTVDIVNVES